MQKERIKLKIARRHPQIMRWLQRYGNCIVAAVVFLVVVAAVVVLAVNMTIEGGQQEVAAAGTSTDKVIVTAGGATVVEEYHTYESMIYSRDWGTEDAEILLKVAMAEAEGENTEGKATVMLVVLNRTWSKDFPNSIEDVVFQDTPGRQFAVTADGGRYWTTTPDKDCIAALQLVESGWDESKGAMYFESCKTDTSWHSRNLQFLFQLGNHKFYK